MSNAPGILRDAASFVSRCLHSPICPICACALMAQQATTSRATSRERRMVEGRKGLGREGERKGEEGGVELESSRGESGRTSEAPARAEARHQRRLEAPESSRRVVAAASSVGMSGVAGRVRVRSPLSVGVDAGSASTVSPQLGVSMLIRRRMQCKCVCGWMDGPDGDAAMAAWRLLLAGGGASRDETNTIQLRRGQPHVLALFSNESIKNRQNMFNCS